MNDRLKALAYDLLSDLRRERDERKFQADMDAMSERLAKWQDEIMKDFRSKINVK
jgi:hypothetical protein